MEGNVKAASSSWRGFSRPFWWFWAGHTASLFGDVLFSAGMMWFVYQATGSALATSGVPLADGLARLLGGVLAGPLADRRVRARWMAEIHLAKMGLVLVVAGMLLQGYLTPAWVYVLTFLLTLLNAFYEPTQGALLPNLVLPQALAQANAFLQVSRTLGYGLSWALSGLSLAQLGPEPVAWGNVLVFALAAGCFVVLHRMRRARPVLEGTKWTPAFVWQDLREGVGQYRKRPLLRSLLLLSVPGWLTFGLWGPLQLVFLNRVLGVGPEGWGWSQATFFLSGLTGAVLATRVLGRARWPEGLWVVGVAAFQGLLTVGFGLAPAYLWALSVVVLAGTTDPFLLSARQALLQDAAPEPVRGRVLAVWNVAMALGTLTSYLLVGVLGEVVPLRGLYVGFGALFLLAVLAVGVGSRLWAARCRASRESKADS